MEEKEPEPPKPVKTESEIQWEQIEKAMSRALKINDLDFTDLTEVDDINYVNAQVNHASFYNINLIFSRISLLVFPDFFVDWVGLLFPNKIDYISSLYYCD